jgi:hypothetical protein
LPAEYSIGKSAACCAGCNREFQRGEEHYSVLAVEPAPAAGASAEQPAPTPPVPEGAEAGATSAPPPGGRLPYRRLDFCQSCWRPEKAAEYFSFWKTAVPDEDPDADKPLHARIDAETVYEIFRRLEGQNDPQKQKFRFILGLILMRRKRLRFTGVASGPHGEHLVLEDRGESITHKVLDPGLNEDEIDSLRGEVDRLLRSAPGESEEAPESGP